MSDLSALFDDPRVEEIHVLGDADVVVYGHGATVAWSHQVEPELRELVERLALRRGGDDE
jgi:type IV secretory pathway ATPase VirB11/archaellum biosynthesis ATPase